MSNSYLSYVVNESDVPATNHLWTEGFTFDSLTACPHLSLLVFFWIFLIGTIFRRPLYRGLSALFPNTIKVGEIEIDEDLDNYFHTIDDHDRNWSVKEEENARDLKFKILADETLDKFKNTKKGENEMKGVHTYDILANPLYLDDF